MLFELSKELKAEGISADIQTVELNDIAGGGFTLLKAIGELSAIAVIVHAYFKHRRARIFVEMDGKRIEVEAKTTDDTKELLKQGVLYLRKMDDKKDDA